MRFFFAQINSIQKLVKENINHSQPTMCKMATWYPAECWLLDKATHDSELEPEVPLGLGTFANANDGNGSGWFAPKQPIAQTSILPFFPSKSWDAPRFQFVKGIIHNIITTCQPKTGIPCFPQAISRRANATRQLFTALQKVSSVSGTELCQMPRLSPSQDSWKISESGSTKC